MKEQIRERYASAAKSAANATEASCCGPIGCCGGSTAKNVITSDLYTIDEVQELPPTAVLASLGCGNPTALAELVPGETVLDLGSGGGIDVLLSARRVGPTGFAYGVDMTDEMLELARKNAAEAGATNVAFLKGDIEHIPLADNSVDVIISNCVINLSLDKDQVFREAFRVLKPGGRFAVSDVVFQGDVGRIPAAIRKMIDAWTGCVAGALEEQEYIAKLQAAGFTGAAIQITRVYGEKVQDLVLPEGVRVASGFVRARKPGAGQYSLRPAKAEDLPAVRRLLNEADLPLDGLEEQFGDRYALAEAGGRVIGAVGIEIYGEGDDRHGLLRSAVVDSAWRGLGAGDALVRERLAWARGQGLRSVYLLTTTAAGYFPRFGFAATDRAAAPAPLQESVEFRHACPGSAVTMALPFA